MKRLKIIYYLLFILGFNLFFSSGAGAANVISSRPRIFFRGEDLSWIRSRCSGSQEGQYNALRNFLSGTGYDGEVNMACAAGDAFIWQVSGESQYLGWAKQYLERYASYYDGAEIWDVWKEQPWYLYACLAYDWSYSGLSADERERYGGPIRRFTEWLMADGANEWGRRRDDIRKDDWSNRVYYEYAIAVLGGIALSGCGVAVYEDTARRAISWGEALFKDNLIPAANQAAGNEGGWHESISYMDDVIGRSLVWSLAGWKSGTGENLFSNNQLLKKLGKWYCYMLLPNGDYLNFGNACERIRFNASVIRQYITCLAKEYQDGYAQDIALRYPYSGSWYDIRHYWTDILWYEGGLGAIDLNEESRAEHFNGIGQVVLRSGWEIGESSLDRYAVFFCGDIYGGHDHSHQNSFIIYYGDYLALDSGGYDSYGDSHMFNYYMRTIAHNSVVVYDAGEDFKSYWPDLGWERLSNDGGQILYTGDHPWRYGDVGEGSKWDTGDIVGYQRGTGYCYMKGEAGGAYNGNKVERYTREVVWLEPGEYIIYDWVKNRGNYEVKWLLHSGVRPEVVGGVLEGEEVSGRIYRYRGDKVKVTRDRGELVVKRLYPGEDCLVRVVGGDGYEFWVDNDGSGVGKNYAYDNAGGIPVGLEDGDWRIEAGRFRGIGEEEYLHYLVTGAPGLNVSEPTYINGTETMGVILPGWIVVFGRGGEIRREIAYKLDITDTNKKNHLVSNLDQAWLYNIFQQESKIGNNHPMKGGVLEFSASGGGNFRIVASILATNLRPGGNEPGDNYNSPLGVLPRERFLSPFLRDSINDYAVFGQEAEEVIIYNSVGEEVTRLQSSPAGGALVWKCADSQGRIVEAGVYVCRIKDHQGRTFYHNVVVVR